MLTEINQWLALIGGLAGVSTAVWTAYWFLRQPLTIKTYPYMDGDHEYVGVTIRNRSPKVVTIEEAYYEFEEIDEVQLPLCKISQSGEIDEECLEDIDIRPRGRLNAVVDLEYNPEFFDPEFGGNPALRKQFDLPARGSVALQLANGKVATSKWEEVDVSSWRKAASPTRRTAGAKRKIAKRKMK